MMSDFVDSSLIYGNVVREMEKKRLNQLVLIEVAGWYQTGIIICCDVTFCYVLTTKSYDLEKAHSVTITFGDGTEKEFDKSTYTIDSGRNVSVIFIHTSVDTIKAKETAKFREGQKLDDQVVFTLGYPPKTVYVDENGSNKSSPAVSSCTGGNVSLVDIKYDQMDVFFHNCTLGDVAIEGSCVLNQGGETVGMNYDKSRDATMALTVKELKYQLGDVFAVLKKKTFVEIERSLKDKARRYKAPQP